MIDLHKASAEFGRDLPQITTVACCSFADDSDRIQDKCLLDLTATTYPLALMSAFSFRHTLYRVARVIPRR